MQGQPVHLQPRHTSQEALPLTGSSHQLPEGQRLNRPSLQDPASSSRQQAHIQTRVLPGTMAQSRLSPRLPTGPSRKSRGQKAELPPGVPVGWAKSQHLPPVHPRQASPEGQELRLGRWGLAARWPQREEVQSSVGTSTARWGWERARARPGHRQAGHAAQAQRTTLQGLLLKRHRVQGGTGTWGEEAAEHRCQEHTLPAAAACGDWPRCGERAGLDGHWGWC